MHMDNQWIRVWRGEGGMGGGGWRMEDMPANETGEDTTQGLNAQRQRCDVQKQQVGHITLHDTPLNGSARGHHLIRVDPPAWLPLEQILYNVAHLHNIAGYFTIGISGVLCHTPFSVDRSHAAFFLTAGNLTVSDLLANFDTDPS